jgi:hypothetical protein
MVGGCVTSAKARDLYEPNHGVYLGVGVSTADGTNGVTDFNRFNQAAGKQHAVYMMYRGAQYPFPWFEVSPLISACPGTALHICYEPLNGFAETFTNWAPGGAIYDLMYSFATNCALFGGPIFLRFAHEANYPMFPWAPG